MSPQGPTEIPAQASSESKSKKKKRKKGAKDIANGDVAQTPTVLGTSAEKEPPSRIIAADDDDEEAEAGEETGRVPQTDTPTTTTAEGTTTTAEGTATAPLANGTDQTSMVEADDSTDARFEALVKDRDSLRAEVTQLRQSIQALQAKHGTNLAAVREELQESLAGKSHAEEQYQTLLGRVNTIKAQLGERLKADAEDLAQARSRIEELEAENASLQEQQVAQSAAMDNLTAEVQTQSKELSSLRNRANLSQQNWYKEREDLIEQEAYSREQFQNAEQAMREWEVLAMEERSIRKDLAERASDLEEQLSGLKEAYDKADRERDIQSNTVDGLQKALQEIQTARKKELREVVESSQVEVENLRIQLAEAQKTSVSAVEELARVKVELDRALPFEKEVKEKNLLIGKLRHEAVTLNEHLTKALRFLKKGKPEDNVDRQIVTNHFLHFLTLDRSDPKKFQILQLISSLLGWTDEQREQAGLSRPGGGGIGSGSSSSSSSLIGGSLRLPHSPLVHRTPSTPSLLGDRFQGTVSGGPGSPSASSRERETLAELWQNFLEQESRGQNTGPAKATHATTTKPTTPADPGHNADGDGRSDAATADDNVKDQAKSPQIGSLGMR